MVANVSYKKVRSISEGNFNGCYASNKAEKFKFRRLSQGLESCAQAQALKLRKEEKQILKLLENLEKEKTKHKNIRDSNQYYLQNIHGNLDTEYVRLDYNNDEDEEPTETLPPLSPLQNRSHHVKPRNSALTLRRHTIHGGPPPTRDFHEVTPFYMEHGYTHYHHDKYYDDLLHEEKPAPTIQQLKNNNQPCWTKPSGLSFLRDRRNTIATTTTEYFGDVKLSNNSSGNKIGNPVKLGINFDMKNSEKIRTASAFSDKTSTSSVNAEDAPSPCSTVVQVGSSIQIFPSIHTGSHMKRRSVLTPFERQELDQHSRHAKSAVSFKISKTDTERSLTNGKLAERRLTMPAMGKMSLLRKMVLKRVKDGCSIEDLLDDPMFDNILDMCDNESVYPAYKPNSSLSLQDFRSLRHCKYLRLSDLNIRSLKQTVFNDLMYC